MIVFFLFCRKLNFQAALRAHVLIYCHFMPEDEGDKVECWMSQEKQKKVDIVTMYIAIKLLVLTYKTDSRHTAFAVSG